MIEKTNINLPEENTNNNVINDDIINKIRQVDTVTEYIELELNKVYRKNIEKVTKLEDVLNEKIKETKVLESKVKEKQKELLIQQKRKELYKLVYNFLENVKFLSSERKNVLKTIVTNVNDLKIINMNINKLKKLV